MPRVIGLAVCRIPDLVSPLLNEVGEVLRDGQYLLHRVVVERHALGSGRLHQRQSRIAAFQRPDFRIVEQPFRIGLGLAGQRRHLRQPRTNEDERQVPLRDFVTCDDDGGQLGGRKVLHFVDKQPHRGSSIRSSLRHRDEHPRQVLLQVAGVPLPRSQINAQFETADSHLECPGEVRQHTCGPTQAVTRSLPKVQGMDDTPQLGRQQLRQRAALRRFDPHGAEFLLVRQRTKPIEKDGLADPAQTEQDRTLGRATVQHAIHVDGGIRKKPTASGQLRRLKPGSGNERVAAAIHVGKLTQI